MKAFFKAIGMWLILLTATDIFFILLTWLIRPEVIGSVSLFIILFSVFILTLGYTLQSRKDKKILDATEKFLESPDEKTKSALIHASNKDWRHIIETTYDKMNKQINEINDIQTGLKNYQEYIEAWTHEIKTPLSLMTLVLENHPDEMTSYVYDRLNYVKLQISQDVERILFYARLQSDHSDYNYTRFRLDKCAQEILQNYAPIAQEKKIDFITRMSPVEVVSDRKVLLFMLSQLVSNAVKYASSTNGKVTVIIHQTEDDKKIHLSVRNNGSSVLAEDLPFIFDKGFTGNHFERQQATGMGLYLVDKYASALNIEIQTECPDDNFGFEIEMIFPYVEQMLII